MKRIVFNYKFLLVLLAFTSVFYGTYIKAASPQFQTVDSSEMSNIFAGQSCHECLKSTACDDTATCNSNSYTSKTTCESHDQKENNGRNHYYCWPRTGYTNCTTFDWGKCATKYYCKYLSTGKCKKDDDTGVYGNRKCTDKDGTVQ